jgi:hypothetical protein
MKRFAPQLTPKQMLKLGVFGGAYFNNASYDKNKNFFKVKASQPLSVWQKKGWIHPKDPKGWFQWYCRYYEGRRLPKEDDRQIKRWLMIRRHIAQLQKHCSKGDLTCRPVQRQALLHWAYDSRKL